MSLGIALVSFAVTRHVTEPTRLPPWRTLPNSLFDVVHSKASCYLSSFIRPADIVNIPFTPQIIIQPEVQFCIYNWASLSTQIMYKTSKKQIQVKESLVWKMFRSGTQLLAAANLNVLSAKSLIRAQSINAVGSAARQAVNVDSTSMLTALYYTLIAMDLIIR